MDFVIAPYLRFEGLPGEQMTMFFTILQEMPLNSKHLKTLINFLLLELFRKQVDQIFAWVFDASVRKTIENSILILAGIGFVIHLGLVFMKSNGLLDQSIFQGSLLNDPISAIYTLFIDLNL